ncbi:hypothetical protein LG293_16370 (plasmid) [Citricoccus nitrophenolicus]
MTRHARTTATILAAATLTLAGCSPAEGYQVPAAAPELSVAEQTDQGFKAIVENSTLRTDRFSVALLEDGVQTGHREVGTLAPGGRVAVYFRAVDRPSTTPDAVRLDGAELGKSLATAKVAQP